MNQKQCGLGMVFVAAPLIVLTAGVTGEKVHLPVFAVAMVGLLVWLCGVFLVVKQAKEGEL